MTTREELRARGFHFFCFTTREDRAAFSLRSMPEEYACEEVDETFCKGKFEVFFLGAKKLHHVPVKFTPPGGLL